jgi:hypothetical protein
MSAARARPALLPRRRPVELRVAELPAQRPVEQRRAPLQASARQRLLSPVLPQLRLPVQGLA